MLQTSWEHYHHYIDIETGKSKVTETPSKNWRIEPTHYAPVSKFFFFTNQRSSHPLPKHRGHDTTLASYSYAEQSIPQTQCHLIVMATYQRRFYHLFFKWGSDWVSPTVQHIAHSKEQILSLLLLVLVLVNLCISPHVVQGESIKGCYPCLRRTYLSIVHQNYKSNTFLTLIRFY